MSAFAVSYAHIAFLVRGLLDAQLIEVEHATFAGESMWLENYLSMQARYGESPVPPEFVYENFLPHVPPGKLPPAWITKAAYCFNYQSCEHVGYTSSMARLLAMALAGTVRNRDAHDGDSVAYNEAPWGIDRYHLTTLDEKFRIAAEAAGGAP